MTQDRTTNSFGHKLDRNSTIDLPSRRGRLSALPPSAGLRMPCLACVSFHHVWCDCNQEVQTKVGEAKEEGKRAMEGWTGQS